MQVVVPYEPNAKQALFHESDADEVVYGGAKGGGKSCGLVMEGLAYALENPGAEVYFFRETYDDLEANIIKEWKEKVPRALYTYNESKHIATLQNGTSVKFRYIQNHTDAEGYQGRSMDWIGVDELTKHEKRSIQVLLSCLRSPKGFKPRFRGTCNPGGIGHVWVKGDFIEATDYGQKITVDPVTGNKREFIPAKVYDNHILMQNDPNYVKRLENLPEDEKKAFLYGDWDIFEGQYFSEWDRDIHVIKPFTIPEHWTRIQAIDDGYAKPFACLWLAFNEEGKCYLYRTQKQAKLLSKEQADLIKRLTMENENIQYSVADTGMWTKSRDTGISPAEVYAMNGVPLVQATKERVNGWKRVRQYLKVYTSKHQTTGEEYKTSSLFVFETCTDAIKDLPALIHADRDPEDLNTNSDDHIADALRYGLMSRPPLTQELTDPRRFTDYDLYGPNSEFDNMGNYDETMGENY